MLKDEKFIKTKGQISINSLCLKLKGKLIRAKGVQINDKLLCPK